MTSKPPFPQGDSIPSILEDLSIHLGDPDQARADLQRLRGEIEYLRSAHAESRRSLEKVEAALAQQSVLLENVHDLVLAMDAEMTITFWNKNAEELSGIPAKEAVGKKFYAITQRMNATLEQREADRARINEKGRLRTENTYLTLDGRLVTMDSINIALRNDAGEITGYIITSRNITESKRAEQLSGALNDIHQIIHSSLNFDAIMQNAVSAAAKALESDTAALSLRADDHWKVRYVYGFPESVIGSEMDDTQERHAILAIQTKQPVAIDETYTDPRVNQEHMQKWGIRSVLVIPVLLRDAVIGVMFFNYQRSSFAFQDYHIDFALKLAASISLALENVRLFNNLKDEIIERKAAEERTRQQNAILAGMNRILEKAITCQTEEELGQVCLSVAEESTQSKFGFICEINAQTGKLDTIAISDPGWSACQMPVSNGVVKKQPVNFNIHGIYGRVILDGKGFFTNDPANHPDRIGTPPGHPSLTAFLGVPLVSGGKVIGMIGLGNREGGYSPETLRAAEVLAPAIVQALYNKRAEEIIEESERSLRESEGRFRVALSSIEMTVYMLDRDLRYTWMYNPRLGMPIDQFIGKRDDDLYPADVARPLIEAKQAVIDTHQRVQREIKVFLNGTWKYFLLSLEPVHDDRGNLIGIIGASLDLTEQREIEIKHHEATTQMEIQRRLMEQREKDRQAIAREIHDGPVQTLVSTLFNVQFAKEAFPDPELRVELEQISLNLKNAVQELRQVINELRPPSVIRFGLKRAIEFHAEDFREKHQEIELSLNLDDDENRLTELNCLTLYRIYQEAIVNVARHAAATRVQVLVELGKDTLVMEIRDNGRGFDMTRDVAYLTQSGHFGMAGMRERAEAINGALSIRSEPGKGTTVRVEIPLPGQSLPKTE